MSHYVIITTYKCTLNPDIIWSFLIPLSNYTVVNVSEDQIHSTVPYDKKWQKGQKIKIREIFVVQCWFNVWGWVVSPVLSRAPKIHSWYMEFSMLSSGGGSMKWKSRRSCTPSDLSSSTTLARLVRWISGIVVVSISFLKALWVYNLNWTNTM